MMIKIKIINNDNDDNNANDDDDNDNNSDNNHEIKLTWAWINSLIITIINSYWTIKWFMSVQKLLLIVKTIKY